MATCLFVGSLSHTTNLALRQTSKKKKDAHWRRRLHRGERERERRERPGKTNPYLILATGDSYCCKHRTTICVGNKVVRGCAGQICSRAGGGGAAPGGQGRESWRWKAGGGAAGGVQPWWMGWTELPPPPG
jgi:hypothetical protein